MKNQTPPEEHFYAFLAHHWPSGDVESWLAPLSGHLEDPPLCAVLSALPEVLAQEVNDAFARGAR